MNSRTELDNVVFLGDVSFRILPRQASSQFGNTATPDVSNLTLIKGSGLVVTITNLIGGADCQQLRIIGDGTTTISNNTSIKTNTGANKLLAVNKVYTFSYFQGDRLWIENV